MWLSPVCDDFVSTPVGVVDYGIEGLVCQLPEHHRRRMPGQWGVRIDCHLYRSNNTQNPHLWKVIMSPMMVMLP